MNQRISSLQQHPIAQIPPCKDFFFVSLVCYIIFLMGKCVNVQIKFLSYTYAVLGSLIVALFVNSRLAKKVKSIDMVSSLKGNKNENLS